jgi:hypothetical protein
VKRQLFHKIGNMEDFYALVYDDLMNAIDDSLRHAAESLPPQ